MDLAGQRAGHRKIISRTLAEAAPGEQSRFEANTQAYLQELEDLDSQFRQVADQGRLHMIVVADKFPFRYFADEYGLSYRAAFSGCSGDTEPSASTIAYLIDKVKRTGFRPSITWNFPATGQRKSFRRKQGQRPFFSIPATT